MKVGDRVRIKQSKLGKYHYKLVLTERSMGFLKQLPIDTIFIIKSIEQESADDQCSSCLHMYMISKETCHYFNSGMGGSGKHNCPTYKKFKAKTTVILQIEDNTYKLMHCYSGDKFDIDDLELAF